MKIFVYDEAQPYCPFRLDEKIKIGSSECVACEHNLKHKTYTDGTKRSVECSYDNQNFLTQEQLDSVLEKVTVDDSLKHGEWEEKEPKEPSEAELGESSDGVFHMDTLVECHNEFEQLWRKWVCVIPPTSLNGIIQAIAIQTTMTPVLTQIKPKLTPESFKEIVNRFREDPELRKVVNEFGNEMAEEALNYFPEGGGE